MNQAVDTILSAPDRVICQALRANISLQQCARNQAQARMDPWGQLQPCLKCRQVGKASKAAAPRSPRNDFGLTVPTKAYREAKAAGKIEPLVPRAGSIVKWKRELRDRSARAGWPTKRIDRMLKRLNGRSTPAVQRAVLREWEGELGEGSGE